MKNNRNLFDITFLDLYTAYVGFVSSNNDQFYWHMKVDLQTHTTFWTVEVGCYDGTSSCETIESQSVNADQVRKKLSN